MVLLGAGYSMANWECVAGRTTGWSCLFTDLGPMLCGLGLVPPSIGLIARWWAARPNRLLKKSVARRREA